MARPSNFAPPLAAPSAMPRISVSSSSEKPRSMLASASVRMAAQPAAGSLPLATWASLAR